MNQNSIFLFQLIQKTVFLKKCILNIIQKMYKIQEDVKKE